jgi:hypothetical protein
MSKRLLLLLLILPLQILLTQNAQAALHITIIQGLGGIPLFDVSFNDQRHKIREASESMTDAALVSTFSGEDVSRESLLAHFTTLAERMSEEDRAAIYLIGHGSYDGEQYKFNIPGPDITDTDLTDILDNLPGQNHFLVNTSSSSGVILDSLENDQRIIITATRNGNEKNATEFGNYFAEALASTTADINKNNIVSIQEAFDFAERGVTEFFESQGKLATEHPQIRGNGAASFSLARLGGLESSSEDPRINTLLSQRLDLDADIEALQLRRNEYTNADYIQRLQALILESAQVSEQIDELSEGSELGVELDSEVDVD